MDLLDWLMILPKSLEKSFWEELKQIEEDKKMPYITSVERNATEQGIQQGELQASRKILINFITERFGEIPEFLIQKIKEINKFDTLNDLLIQAMKCENINAFHKRLK